MDEYSFKHFIEHVACKAEIANKQEESKY